MFNPCWQIWHFIWGAAPNQHLQAGITIITWEEMQLRELHFKMLSFQACRQVPPCHFHRCCSEARARELLPLSWRKVLGGDSLGWWQRWSVAGRLERKASRLRRAFWLTVNGHSVLGFSALMDALCVLLLVFYKIWSQQAPQESSALQPEIACAGSSEIRAVYRAVQWWVD